MNNRKKKYLGTPFQKKILLLVLLSAIIPSAIVTICLYYLIFNMMAGQLGIPEAIAYNVLPVANKVSIIIAISLPVSVLAIWFIALEVSNRIAGPLYRIEKELDEKIAGRKTGPIKVRLKDDLRALADRINKLVK